MGFEHAVLAAEVAVAEAAVADDALGKVLAFLEGAARSTRGHIVCRVRFVRCVRV